MISLTQYINESKDDKILNDIFNICQKYQPKYNHSMWSLQEIKRPKDRRIFKGVALVKDNQWYNAIFYFKNNEIYLSNVFDVDIQIPEEKLEYTIKFLIDNQRPYGDINNIDELKRYIIFK